MPRSPAMTALRAKYGKYVPHQRANVDQVPLPFVMTAFGEHKDWVLLEKA